MSLPSGYKRLEYIQSSGTQRIDTGIKPNQDTRVIMDVLVLDSQTVEGHLCSVTGSYYYVVSFTPTISTWWRTRYGSSNLATFSASINNRGRLTIDKNKNVTTILGESITLAESTFQMSLDMPLLCRNANGTYNAYISARLYSCQIYDNGTLIRDYIPCQTTSGEVGLWDDVNSVFYGNAGTGTFTAGPVVAISAAASEITELEYIESTGTQYLNTVFKPNNNTRVVMDLLYTGSESISNEFGAWNSSNNASFISLTTGKNNLYPFYGNTSKQVSADRTARHTVDMDKNVVKMNGTTMITFDQMSFQCTYPMFLCCFNNAGVTTNMTSMRIYSCQIYGNEIFFRDYIAAKLSDGTVGLYDKLHGLLYLNVGSGAFTAGPEVQKAPQTPTGFAAAFLTETTVQLSWSSSDEATGYKLYKNGDLLATLTDTSYTDTVQIFSGTVYAVTAYNDNGESEAATLTYYAAPENPVLYLVTDRTKADVINGTEKGSYNASNLNRVGAAMNYVADRLRDVGYDPHINPKTDWKDGEWVTQAAQAVYLGGLAELRKQFTLYETTPEVPPRILATAINSNDGLTYIWANDIEQILMDIDVLLTNIAAGWFYSGEIYSGEV